MAMAKIIFIAILATSSLLCSSVARAQDTAEAAATTSATSTAVHATQAPTFNATVPAGQGSPHLLARTGPPPEEINRKEFEDNAGDKAGKLLLRSEPSGAQVFVNHLLVGRTPMLMIVAPGNYKIDMRGARETWGHSSVGVMPRGTQTVAIKLNQEYPASITIH